MLASTMQHSTHNHTPTHHRHHTHNTDALDDRTRSGTKKTLHAGVSSGPNSVPNLKTTTDKQRNVPPSHTHTPPTTAGTMLDQAWNQ